MFAHRIVKPFAKKPRIHWDIARVRDAHNMHQYECQFCLTRRLITKIKASTTTSAAPKSPVRA